ncbi:MULTISPECIES: flagellin [unclassified Pseudomonas]|jgi:Flagellin and related hook-associated proteins|uniref:flagellin N-terminal helical domain-containing protein n=1 Tax=unclassified Pseudomonas TaxID=196821 RepID=UPI00040BB6E1|nr:MULTISPECIES: flagellin [unclassified Pseudomonas]ATP49188.1 flagellin [Pseudomonas putida]SMF03035.1 flagellin [Pseudomonas sp. LAIL14HWK12:I11]SMR72445.1 flagellin [Pseudomonas sp. LAIL14HWK12:I10]SOD01354.1 flagellin [Pseudomonas sp. LAIL14HWK12:I8]GLO57312.1 flagellin [Pseudomonas putida]
MALTVNTNITSLGVQKNLNRASDALGTSMSRLSSGLKINSAKDDAAGLQIGNRLTSQIKGLSVAVKNANDGISIAQTAEGAMQESTSILQRMRELSLQSANGSNSDDDRTSLQQEFTALSGELTRIANTTTFGGRKVLDGSFQNVSFQIGSSANETISFGMTDISSTGLKGSFSEAKTDGVATDLSAVVTGAVATSASTFRADPVTFAPVAAGETVTLTLNGTAVALDDTDTAATTVGKINAANTASNTGVTAAIDGNGDIVMSSSATFTATAATTGGGTAGFAATATVAAGFDSDISFNINGTAIGATAGQDMSDVLAAINAETATTGVAATLSSEGRLQLSSADGKAINLTNGTGAAGQGALAKVGLAAGTTEAKLVADTSISLNGTEVKFTKGDTLDGIISAINTASTGVTASKNADNTLKLFSKENITVADGSQGTGLAALGLATTNSTVAITQETTVSNLSITTAADSQKAIQALDAAIAQIDSQRAQLGAVQNRFDSTVANLNSISENSTAARSRVQDADFASETAELTKQQTLQQASTAILSQANQLPSSVLKLLG